MTETRACSGEIIGIDKRYDSVCLAIFLTPEDSIDPALRCGMSHDIDYDNFGRDVEIFIRLAVMGNKPHY